MTFGIGSWRKFRFLGPQDGGGRTRGLGGGSCAGFRIETRL